MEELALKFAEYIVNNKDALTLIYPLKENEFDLTKFLFNLQNLKEHENADTAEVGLYYDEATMKKFDSYKHYEIILIGKNLEKYYSLDINGIIFNDTDEPVDFITRENIFHLQFLLNGASRIFEKEDGEIITSNGKEIILKYLDSVNLNASWFKIEKIINSNDNVVVYFIW